MRMHALELVVLLLTVSAALRVVAGRLPVPYATLLVLGGLGLALVPNLPRIAIAPDLLFILFVPPLLYGGAMALPLRDFREALGPILRLAIGMVLVSVAAVAVAVHAIDPAFSWAAAFALGAIVSAPDPVAVLSVARSLVLPRELASILEGEGLLNDATALVAYRIAVAAAVTGTFVLWRTVVQFAGASIGGVVAGLVVGVLAGAAHRLTREVPVAENTISLVTPFAAYLAAEAVGASGVIAVVAAAMWLARYAGAVGGPAARLQNAEMWVVVSFVLESLVFILVGLELPIVIAGLGGATMRALVGEAVVVCACLIVVRLLWVFPSTYVGRSLGRWLRHSDEPFPSWRQIAFVGWAGMRGGDSLVIALALPLVVATGAPFPARNRVIFLAFSVILATLVIQGATLLPVARWLGLHDDGRRAADEEAHARLVAAEAGLHVLADPALARARHPEVLRYLRQRQRQRARRWAARETRNAGVHDPVARGGSSGSDAMIHDHVTPAPSHEAGRLDEERATSYSRVREAMIRAEEGAIRQLRDRGEIGDDVMRAIQRDLDLELLLLGSPDPVREPPPEARIDRQLEEGPAP